MPFFDMKALFLHLFTYVIVRDSKETFTTRVFDALEGTRDDCQKKRNAALLWLLCRSIFSWRRFFLGKTRRCHSLPRRIYVL